MLRHDIAGLVQAGPGATQKVTIDDPHPAFGADLEVVAPIQGVAEFHRTQDSVVVWGDMATEVRLECSRCLQPLTQKVRARFEEAFAMPFGADDPEGFSIDEHNVLDLTEAARQYLVTALPLNPLCRVDCPGLCPQCGAPLDGHRCAEEPAQASNPFSTLSDLL